jgi:hypothetical protein
MEKLLSSSIPDPGSATLLISIDPCPSLTWCWVPDSPWVWGWRSCWARQRVPGSGWPGAAPRSGSHPSSTQSLPKIYLLDQVLDIKKIQRDYRYVTRKSCSPVRLPPFAKSKSLQKIFSTSVLFLFILLFFNIISTGNSRKILKNFH